MAVNDKLTVTYGGQAVGGTSDVFLLHGPHSWQWGFEGFGLSFTIVLVASSYATVVSNSKTLEAAFSKRLDTDETLVVSVDGNTWTYTQGTDLMDATATIEKTGDERTDKGYSRSYAVNISAGLPAGENDRTGLQDLSVDVAVTPSRQKTVRMTGVYTLAAGSSALTVYQANFAAEAINYLTLIDSSATFELVDEGYSLDRHRAADDQTPHPNMVEFQRTYVELTFAQSQTGTDDTDIRDHRVVFTDLSQFPGDGGENIQRMRRVAATYSCAIDIDQTTNLKSVFDNKVRPHLKSTFRTTFNPNVFAVESVQVNYNETSKRLEASVVFVYQAAGGSDVVQVSQTVDTEEVRTIDYTPTHEGGELDAYADVGFAVKRRTWTRVAVMLADPNEVTGGGAGARGGGGGGALRPTGFGLGTSGSLGSGIFGFGGGLGSGVESGWNTIKQASRATPNYVGDPADGQIQLTTVTDIVVEQFHNDPEGGGSQFPGFEFPNPSAGTGWVFSSER